MFNHLDKLDQLFLVIILIASCAGFYCLGRFHESAERMIHWQNGFDQAKALTRREIKERLKTAYASMPLVAQEIGRVIGL